MPLSSYRYHVEYFIYCHVSCRTLTDTFLGRTKAEQLSSQAAQQAAMASDPNPFLPATEAQRIMGGAYPDADDLARASLAQMSEISRRAAVAGMTFSTEPQAQQSQQPQQNGMNGASGSGSVSEQRVNGDGRPPSSMGMINTRYIDVKWDADGAESQ